MHRAVSHQQLQLATSLIERKANLEAVGKDIEKPLLVACGDMDCLDLAMLKLLVDKRADVNAFGKQDDTALMRLASHGNAEAVKLVLQAKADPHLLDTRGHTALAIAIANGNNARINWPPRQFAEVTELLRFAMFTLPAPEAPPAPRVDLS